jgi:hypothetical protein
MPTIIDAMIDRNAALNKFHGFPKGKPRIVLRDTADEIFVDSQNRINNGRTRDRTLDRSRVKRQRPELLPG